jgi:hypothetical protein
MRKVAARLRTGLVDGAEIPVEECAALRRALQNSRREPFWISHGILPPHVFGFGPQVSRDGLDLGLIHDDC